MIIRSITAVVTACVITGIAHFATAQPIRSNNRQLLGAFIGYQGSFYSTSVDVYPGGQACGVFDQGSGWNPIFGIIAEFPLGRKLNLAPRVYWDNRSGSLTTTHSDNSALVNGVPTVVDMQYTLAITLRQVSLDLPVKWMPFNRNNLYLIGGATIGYILSDHYHQSESVLSPSSAYFKENGRQDRDLRDGSFTTLSPLQFGMCLGMGYDLPVSKKTFIAPEISTVIGFNSILKDTSFTVTTLRFTAALKTDISSWFGTGNEPPPPTGQSTPEPEPENPPMVRDHERSMELPVPTAAMSLMGVMPDGDQTPHPTLTVEEFITTDLRPVLNYVFFDEGSSTIPSRYVNLTSGQAEAFTDTALIGSNTLDLYYQTLNLVGRRMRDHAKSVLTVRGCNSNEGQEKGNTDLSFRRAQAVRDYLTHTWSIDGSRIKISTQNLPDDPSRIGTAFGAEENRRAELWCDDPQVISPVTLAGTERVASPPKIRMYMHSDNDSLITSWHAEAVQGKNTLAATSGKGRMPASFDWVMSSVVDTLIHSEEPVRISLTVQDAEGRATTTSTSIEMRALTLRRKREQRIENRRVDKFSLFLFDFDQASLSKRTEAVLQLISKAVQSNSTVLVTGYTDRTGEAEHNKQLSEARARTVADYINRTAHPQKITSIGFGDTQLLFDNALPEGRYFNRTVYVRVETPIAE